jgi:hypothetical protein
MKDFIKVLDKNGEAFKHLGGKFSKISQVKLTL